MVDPPAFLRLCLDPIRLAVLGRAAEGRLDIDEVAAVMGVSHRVAVEAVGRVRAVGLVDDKGRLNSLKLREIAEALPSAPPPSPTAVAGPWTAEETEVLSRFFSGDRLTEIPRARAKRLVVLERLAQEFEPGVRYAEADVNFTLQLFHRDHAALRRYLVDEGLLTRAEGVYWRSGGRYQTASPPAES